MRTTGNGAVVADGPCRSVLAGFPPQMLGAGDQVPLIRSCPPVFVFIVDQRPADPPHSVRLSSQNLQRGEARNRSSYHQESGSLPVPSTRAVIACGPSTA